MGTHQGLVLGVNCSRLRAEPLENALLTGEAAEDSPTP